MLTVRQAATRLGVSPCLVYALCSAGRIRHEHNNDRLLNDLVGRGCVRHLFEHDAR